MDLFVNKNDTNNKKSLSNSINLTSNLDSINSINPNMMSVNQSDNRKLYHSTSVNFGYENATSTRYRTTSKSNNQTSSRHNSFIHDSINSSLDFPTYIPWQSLSTEVNENLKSGALIINKSNRLEWASPIKEDNERANLLNNEFDDSDFNLNSQGVTKATNNGVSWTVAAFLLVNCALGAGILNYPAAYDKVGGIFIATLFQLVLMVVLGLTMIILVYSSDLNGDNTYHDVILSMCGKRMQQLAAVSILMTCYGICVTFLIIIGDQMEKVNDSLQLNDNYWFLERKYIIAILSIVFILPMCYFNRLDFLKYAGALGVFSMFYVVFINIYQYFYLNCQHVELRTKPESFKSMIAVIPVICFAYQTHEIASYLTFGINVSPDIMMMYDTKQPIILFGNIALVIKMLTTYPSILFCGRNALIGLYAEFMRLNTDQIMKGEMRRRIIITTFWFVTTLLLAIYTPNIGVVIELLGSLASLNVFIFPSICLIVIVDRLEDKISKLTKTLLYSFSVFLILFGIIIFFIVISEVYIELTDPIKQDIVYNVTMCKHF